jgi:hypothetical protein
VVCWLGSGWSEFTGQLGLLLAGLGIHGSAFVCGIDSGSISSGVEEVLDVIGTVSDTMVVLAVPMSSVSADAGWLAGAPTRST